MSRDTPGRFDMLKNEISIWKHRNSHEVLTHKPIDQQGSTLCLCLAKYIRSVGQRWPIENSSRFRYQDDQFCLCPIVLPTRRVHRTHVLTYVKNFLLFFPKTEYSNRFSQDCKCNKNSLFSRTQFASYLTLSWRPCFQLHFLTFPLRFLSSTFCDCLEWSYPQPYGMDLPLYVPCWPVYVTSTHRSS